MDLLETYDSDEERAPDPSAAAPDSSDSVRRTLEEYRKKFIKSKVNGPLKNGHAHIQSQKLAPPPPKTSEMSLLSYDDKDAQSTLRSRLYAAYDKAEYLSRKQNEPTQEAPKPSKMETVVYEKKDEAIVSIELGSRDNTSGLLRVDGEDDPKLRKNRNDEAVRRNADKRAKKLAHEHTRKENDMMYENYPVDHPLYKSHTTLANYVEDGATHRLNESHGSIHLNPSGVTEKIYYDEAAFQEGLLQHDLRVVLENDASVADAKRRRLKPDEVGSEDIFGPWIPFEEGELPVYTPAAPRPEAEAPEKKKPRAKNQLGAALTRYTPDQALPLNEVVVTDGKQVTKFNDVNVSTFNRKVEPDRKYRSWVAAPKNAKAFDPATYKAHLPKNEVFTYLGHTMAVQKIDFFPRTGHLMLSAAMDGFVKIWDVNNARKCVRTYKGHAKGVRDISFVEGGTKFFSLSFDCNAILWDTEYGKVVGVYPTDKTPYCLTVYPNEEAIFIVGGENKKACQFDARTGEVAVEYAEHLGCVNTATFIDGNRRLLTTGDDKKLLVWDYGIPVVVKHITNPAMPTLPAVVNHPNDKFVLAQSMDNQIIVFESAGSRFKQFGRKRFRGHQNSGYAIRPSVSPDGRYVASGDARGKLFIWDWKTCKNLQTLTGHKAVVMDARWHPAYPSTLATCSWDGAIKLWE